MGGQMAMGGPEAIATLDIKRDQNKAGSTSSIEPLSARVSQIDAL